MIYGYKSDELTQEVFVKCINTIVDDIIDEYSTLRRYENISIYAPSYIVKEALGMLLDETEDLWVDNDSEIDLLHKVNNDVVVTIAYDGMVFVEDARYDGVIKSNEDSCLTYFYDGLGKKDLDALEENADDHMHGFSVNRSDENGYSSYSFYSTDMDLVEYMARLFR